MNLKDTTRAEFISGDSSLSCLVLPSGTVIIDDGPAELPSIDNFVNIHGQSFDVFEYDEETDTHHINLTDDEQSHGHVVACATCWTNHTDGEVICTNCRCRL